jgi:hypothetical protein
MAYVATPIADFAEWRNDIERHYLSTLDRCDDLGERLRCGQRVERIRTTPDLPVRLLGVRRTARAVIAARTRPRPGSAGNDVIGATDELRQRDGIVRISS